MAFLNNTPVQSAIKKINIDTLNAGNKWNSVDFVGISESGISSLQSAIVAYAESVEDTLSQFQESAQVATAFRGTEIETAVTLFVTEVKELLIAYANLMKKEAESAGIAYVSWSQQQKTLSGNVDTTTGDISSTAASLRGEADSVSLE